MPPKKQPPPLSSDDATFFQGFYEENRGFLYYICRQYSDCECDDLMQDALLRLMRNTDKLRILNRQQTAKYIALTVRSVYLDIHKKQSGNMEISLDDPVAQLLNNHTLPDQSSLTDILSMQQEVSLLKSSLNAREWHILEGKYILGYDQKELSHQIGVSPDSIRMILSRARKKARSILLEKPENGGGSQ